MRSNWIQNQLIKCKEELSSFAFNQTKPTQDNFKANTGQFVFKVSPTAALGKQYIHCSTCTVFANSTKFLISEGCALCITFPKSEFFG